MNPTPSPRSRASVSPPTLRRPRRDVTFWQPALDRLAASGLTVAAFCEREGLSASSIYHWRRKLDPTRADPDALPRVVRLDQPASAAGPVRDATPADPVTAELPNGTRLTADARHLATLVGALAAC